MTYWRATVERPDGAGGWTVVGVFGTPDTPGRDTGRYLHGDTPLAAAQLLLSHVWPVNLAQFNQREDRDLWADERAAKTGIAGHRITVDVDESNRWSVNDGQPIPEPLTITVAELRLLELRTAAAVLADSQARLRELREQVRRARSDVQLYRFRAQRAGEEAARAGVPEPEVAKASRPPRKPRKNTST